jgi:hypothetical protein
MDLQPLPALFPSVFVGYARIPGSRWEAVCSADSWSLCWDKLLLVRRPGAHVEKLVSTRHPADHR